MLDNILLNPQYIHYIIQILNPSLSRVRSVSQLFLIAFLLWFPWLNGNFLGGAELSSHAIQLSKTGCPCSSPCILSGPRYEPWCYVSIDSCKNRSTVLVEMGLPPADVFFSSNQIVSSPPAQHEKKQGKRFANGEVSQTQLDYLYSFLNLVSTLLNRTIKPVSPRRQLRYDSGSYSSCICKEDITGIWDNCYPLSNESSTNFSETRWNRSNRQVDFRDPITHQLPPASTSTPRLPYSNDTNQIISMEGCHSHCRTCLSTPRNSEFDCIQCNNNDNQSYVFIPNHTSSLHGQCRPITSSPTHCHPSCKQCLLSEIPYNAKTCVSCSSDATLFPKNIGQCRPQKRYPPPTNPVLKPTYPLIFWNSENVSLPLPVVNVREPNKENSMRTMTSNPPTVHDLHAEPRVFPGSISPTPHATNLSSYVLPSYTNDHFPSTRFPSTELVTPNLVSAFENHPLSQQTERQSSTMVVNSDILQDKDMLDMGGTTLTAIHQETASSNDIIPNQQRRKEIDEPVISHRWLRPYEQFAISEASENYCAAIWDFITKPLLLENDNPLHRPEYQRLGKRYWTQLVYLQADNNIQYLALNNLQEMLHPELSEKVKSLKDGQLRSPDYMHLVVLLDTRQIDGSDTSSMDDALVDDVSLFSTREQDNLRQEKPFVSSFFSRASRNHVATFKKFAHDLVVCADLPITDNVRHHNIDETKGEAYELYRVKNFDESKKTFIDNDYRWLLLRRRGEVDMNDPLILSDFISRSLTVFPSEHTSLVFWNHGAAWRGLGDDNDNADGAPMSLFSIGEGIAKGLSTSRLKGFQGRLTLLGFDACTMNELTVVEMLSNYTDFFIGSQNTEPARGWDWGYLAPVVRHNNSHPIYSPYRPASPLEYASSIVRGYVNTNRKFLGVLNFTSQYASTLSVIEIAGFSRFIRQFDILADLLYACGGHHLSSYIQSVMESLPLLDAYLEQKLCGCVDLGEFLLRFVEKLLIEGIDYRVVSEVVKTTDLYHKMFLTDVPREAESMKHLKYHGDGNGMQTVPSHLFTGLSLYFPFAARHCKNISGSLSTSIYYQRQFKTSWSRFLKRVINKESGKNCVVYVPSSHFTSLSAYSSSQHPNQDSLVISSVNISVASSGVFVPKYAIHFSSFISGYFSNPKTLAGVTLANIPTHWVSVPASYNATVLLTREIYHDLHQQPSDSHLHQSIRIYGAWDLDHFVLVQPVNTLKKTIVTKRDHLSQHDEQRELVAPIYVSFAPLISIRIVSEDNTTTTKSQDVVFKNVHLAYIKYYISSYDVDMNLFELGWLLFNGVQDEDKVHLLIKKKNGWKVELLKQAKGYIRPLLYLTRTQGSFHISRTTRGKLMTGDEFPRHIVSDAVDSHIVFSLENQPVSIRKWDHTTFLSRVIFPYTTDQRASTKLVYRGVVGFSVKPLNESRWNFYLFSIPDLQEEGFPFCIASYDEENKILSRSHNGVCDVLIGKYQCDQIRDRKLSGTDTVMMLSSFTPSLDASYNILESEHTDCWIKTSKQWAVPLMTRMASDTSLRLSLSVDSHHSSFNCEYCGENTVCEEQHEIDSIGRRFTCVCKQGYTLSEEHRMGSSLSQENKFDCVDINECKEYPPKDTCDEHSSCVNLPGSYACLCSNGYVEDSTAMCVREQDCLSYGKNGECFCLPGYQAESLIDVAHDTRRRGMGTSYGYQPLHDSWRIVGAIRDKKNNMTVCKDINECEAGTSTCHPLAVCQNLPGGYACICSEGYDGDGHQCVSGYHSVTVFLRLVIFPLSHMKMGNSASSALLTKKIQSGLPPYPPLVQVASNSTPFPQRNISVFSLPSLPFSELEDLFAKGISQALGISRWRVTLVEPLVLLDRDNSLSKHLLPPTRLRNSEIPKVYRCTIRLLSLPSALLTLPTIPSASLRKQSSDVFKELSSYHAAIDLKRQLNMEYSLYSGIQQSTLYPSSQYPLHNSAIVGPLFASITKNIIFDSFRFDPNGSSTEDAKWKQFVQQMDWALQCIRQIWHTLSPQMRDIITICFTIVSILLLVFCVASRYQPKR